MRPVPNGPLNTGNDGVARQFENGPVVVLDAGHTAVKRAYAEVAGGEVVQLQPGPLLALPESTSDGLLDFLVETLLQTIPTGQRVEQFRLSLSVHLDAAGNVDSDSAASSFWGQLSGLDLVSEIQEALERHLRYACRVKVLHEGQAAVHGLPGMDASILLGTSVGGALKQEGQREKDLFQRLF